MIAQQLNSGGSRKVAEALDRRNTAVIARIAWGLEQAGAHYLDVHAAAGGAATEPELLRWLVEIVQDAVDLPLCLDTVNPCALQAVLPLCRRPPILNSFSGAMPDPEGWLDLVRHCSDAPIVAVCYDTRGTQATMEERMKIAEDLVKTLKAHGVGERRLILDPVTLPSACGEEALRITLETMQGLRQRFPEARVLGGPSNFSYGLTRRREAERVYTARARQAGAEAFLCRLGSTRRTN